MIIGVPKEIKVHEYRVGLTPASASEFIRNGHPVFVETGAGEGIGFTDDAYRAVGAEILSSAAEVFASAEMIVKVKEPQLNECAMLTEKHLLFTYLHLAPDPKQTEALMASGCTAIAYETVTNDAGGLPLLAPMSEVAGRMSIQAGAHALEKEAGGRGLLLGGVPGVAPAKVVIIGGGVSGMNATEIAVGMGADVSVFDRNLAVLSKLDHRFRSAIKTRYSTAHDLEDAVLDADLVIGAVLVAGAAAPKLVTEDMVREMKEGSVLVDISIDQGGCFATSHPTTHADPTFIKHGVVHYCVANMPGAVARTSTFALNNATLPFGLALANKGWKQAVADDPHLKNGVNVSGGFVTYEAVARDLGKEYRPL
ncbi:alanine dehydrogenase [Emcibacter nanhaiensis]|uniref:Alanine dehydrogenase n=1 Tax=Emcibacter nanhaiensis TaxID=1505037 RepID=A0A501PQL4_9PROT|nr:alanine dehydrogenase [Emcibacter nanhaiensis]TPD62753.1 alanine dehydrogenase [Emcibacter nanhaiensis]